MTYIHFVIYPAKLAARGIPVMAIYDPLNESGYEICHPVDDDNFEVIADLCNGTPRSASWIPFRMQLHRENEGKALREADAPWLGAHVLILRRRAITALGSLLRENGELLPLDCPGTELWLYNVTHVIDALDEAASTIDRFPDGRIILVRKPVFYKDRIKGVDAFKYSHRRGRPICVSQRFVDHWHAARLTGVEFKQVWSG